tara:strand:- start:996 stop:6428 length:5433 start_codon:yes stop_codon:yes gene_type:complete
MTIKIYGDPYFDDFLESKNFHRILFKPGFSVQARELTQLQSLLQAQIDRHGQYSFKDGSRVVNGKVSVDTNIDYVKVEDAFNDGSATLNTSTYLSQFVGRTITGATSGVTATVIDHVVAGGTAPNGDAIVNTLYVQYTNTGSNNTTKVFTAGEILNATNSNGAAIKAMVGGGTDTDLNASGNQNSNITAQTGKGSRANIEEGVYFISGNFVFVAEQSLILENYATTPSFLLSLQVTEEIINSNTDPSLLDNAAGTPNSTAPGADRYKIGTKLIKHKITDADPTGYTQRTSDGLKQIITLLKIVDGKIAVDRTDKTDDTPLSRRLARRTFEESGNYSVEPFQINVKEYLNDGSNNGFKTAAQIVADGDAANTALATQFGQDRLSLSVEPNVAYVKGHRIEKLVTERVIVKKPRAAFTDASSTDRVDNDAATNAKADVQSTIRVGNFAEIILNTVEGVPDVNGFTTIDLFTSTNQSGSSVGTARVRGISADDEAANARIYLFDINMTSGAFSAVNSFQETANTTLRFKGQFKQYNSTGAQLFDTNNLGSIIKLPNASVKSVSSVKYTTKKRFVSSVSSTATHTFTLGTGESAINVAGSGYIFANVSGSPKIKKISAIGSGTGVEVSANSVVVNLASNNLYGSGAAAANVHLIIDVEKTATQRGKSKQTGVTATGTVGTVDGVANALSLAKSDILKITSITEAGNSQDIKDQFELDDGQRETIYEIGKVFLKPGFQAPVNAITVTFEHFTHSAGDFFSVDSYGFANYEVIPKFKTLNREISLRDALDFRAVRDNSGGFSGTGGNPQPLVDSSIIEFDLRYYLPRIDKLILTREGKLEVKEGVADERPSPPVVDDDAFALYDLRLRPYIFNLNDFKPKINNTQRYTMKDIGNLDRRIKNLEYYTSLSLLEQSAADVQIFDGNSNSRTKNGFIVDGFFGHNIGDPANPDYSAAIDKKHGQLRPKFDERNVNLVRKAGDTGTAVKSASLVTMPMLDDVAFVDQPYSSTISNVNPYNVFTWGGVINLTPSSDEWKEVDIRPAVIIDDTAQYDQFVKMAEEEGILGTVWNEWETNWTGEEIDIQVETGFGENGDGELEEFIRTTETKTITSNQTRDGLRTEVGFDTVYRSDGFKVVEINFLPFIRSRKVFFDAQLLKPNTKFFAFFDGVELTNTTLANSFIREESSITEFSDQTAVETFEGLTGHPSTGTDLISDGTGRIKGSFIIPRNDVLKFAAGVREFRLSDDSNNNKSNETSFAEAQYHAQGMLEVLEETITSTKVPKIVHTEVNEDRTVTETEVTETVEWVDPIAQTFLVDKDGGIFVKSVQIFFQTKDDNIPVRLSIRTTKNGFPTQRIVPGADKIVYPGDVNTSTDASAGTTFSFDHPVYLNQDGEYAIVLTSQCDNYNVYIAETGAEDLTKVGERITKQPYGGVFFSSANASTWTPEQSRDMKFKLNRAEFNISSTAVLTLQNDSLPKRRMGGNPFVTNKTSGSGSTFGSNKKIVLVRHPNHGMYQGNEEVIIEGVSADVNGINKDRLNGTHTIANVTHDTYTITLTGTNSDATSDGRGGGSGVKITENRHMDVMYPVISNITVPGTKVRYFVRTVSGKSINGSETGKTKDAARFEILPNRTFTFANPRCIYSDVNGEDLTASNRFGTNKSFQLEVELSSTKSHLSPVIDMDRTSVHTIQNRIGNSGSASSGELAARGGTELARYITRKIQLQEEADVFNVYLNAHKPTGTDILLYYRVLGQNSKKSIFDEPFILADSTTVPFNDTGFEEVEWSVDPAGTFGVVQFKIVMVSNSSSIIPKVKDFRAICST